MKEEILQPPEPHPVPPILTPSPPSAFPTVTNVRQDNDRYHPKPVIHVLSTTQPQVSVSARAHMELIRTGYFNVALMPSVRNCKV